MSARFLLGTHQTGWLAKAGVPLFVSDTWLRERGIARLHGFGVKALGLDLYGDLIASADSLAWSIDARLLRRPSPWCTDHRAAKNCASCLTYALAWRERSILPRLTGPSATATRPVAPWSFDD